MKLKEAAATAALLNAGSALDSENSILPAIIVIVAFAVLW